jgi:alkylation response protein AidB-like acyl-CoA dehydrogenase
VDFQLTPEEEELRDATRKLCAGRFPVEKLRASEGGPLDRGMWAELSDFGVFSLRQPEAGGGPVEAALVFEELGRGLVPGPLVWTHLAAGLDLRLGPVVGGLEGRPETAIVEHLADLDDLIVLDDEGLWRVDVSALEGRRIAKPLDPLTPVWVVDDLPRGDQVGDAAGAARWRLEGAAFVSAQLAGMAEALTDLTVAYTSERRQFGRPVGSFQAVKHLLADMLVRSELARTQAYAAAAHLEEPALGGTERAVSSAKSVAGRAARANGAASIQAHGGMGYTWEVDAHLYLKRAWVLDALFGSADDHADAVADLLG